MPANYGTAPVVPTFVPIRAQPDQEDREDQRRADLVLDRWHGQDTPYIGFSKTLEEHVRMLSGRQWDVWSDVLGRFIDVLQYMSEDEKRWRQRPVMDYLGYWFQLTLSKCTENPPVISFLPATLDRLDAMLAEVMDPVWKTIYDEGDMDETLIRAAAWALVGGESYIGSRADFDDGPSAPVIGPAVLSLTRPDGTTVERIADAVPYDEQGNPQAQLQEDPEAPGEYGYDIQGEPWQGRQGSMAYDAYCPLEIRAQWGQHIPWKKKNWITHRWFLTPADVERRWGVQVKPDHYADHSDQSPGYLERMLFGSGYYGAARSDPNAMTTDTITKQKEGYVCGYTMWEKPDPRHTPANKAEGRAGGRLLIVTASRKVLWDSERPFMTEAAGPIRRVSYMDIPGRPFGSTPLEKMVPLQKRVNRVESQIAEHTNLVTNPVLLVHELAGIGDDEWVARPGTVIPHGFVGPGAPAMWLGPPALSADVWKHREAVIEQLFIIGAMAGNQSQSPTENASGELVEQLRFNADRPLAPLTRSMARAMADVAEDTVAILPTIWTAEKIINYAGADNVVRTVTVMPEMFEGRCVVRPTLDSAAAESRDQKQARLTALYQLGVWGNIQDPSQQPKAAAKLLEMLQYPDMTRAMRPGGVDRITAEHNLGRLVRGDQAQAIPLFEWYALDVHLDVLQGYMKSPEYLDVGPQIQKQCTLLREMIMGAQMVQAKNLMMRQAGMATTAGIIQAGAQGTVKRAAVATGAVPADPSAENADGDSQMQAAPAEPGAGGKNAPSSPSAAPRPAGSGRAVA